MTLLQQTNQKPHFLIFVAVKGFHLRYEDEKLEDVIKSWNVKSISVSLLWTLRLYSLLSL